MQTFPPLGLTIPLIQAPMAGVSTPELAAAVSNAGALGSIAVGHIDPMRAREQIRQTKSLTTRPFNVNLFCHAPAIRDTAKEAAWLQRLAPLFERYGAIPPTGLHEIYKSFNGDHEMLDVLQQEQPAVVSFHFGLPPASFIDALKKAGIVLLATATSLEEARQMEVARIDGIVAQGIEAGGHRGIFDPDLVDDQLTTFALTRLLAREVGLPVIAAGGIMDGAGIAAALKLGAAGAQLGTAFIGCPESSASATFRENLGSPAARHTLMTRVVSGRPARSLPTKFTQFGKTIPPTEIPAYPIAYDAGKALAAAANIQGDEGFGAQWAGQGAPLARTMPAGKLVGVLSQEIEEAMASRE